MHCRTSAILFLICHQPATAADENSLIVNDNGDVLIQKNLGTHGFQPSVGLPSGWGGGIHTWDIYAEGTIATGTNGVMNAFADSNGRAYFAGPVGIGTTNPKDLLDVNGRITLSHYDPYVRKGVKSAFDAFKLI